MLSDQDKTDLHKAAELVNAVLDRHHTDMTLPVMSLLTESVNDMRIAERYLEADSVPHLEGTASAVANMKTSGVKS